ncbi:MAG: alpha/beta hydrolase [Myxococcales bacterium]|nr:alpha/beta hydrolase [Myxococcales bacterium]MDH3844784.1 alpha/beta hydrolase [Myxococcales bacterium]
MRDASMHAMNADEWQQRGHRHRVGAHELFCVDTGGDKPVLLILHGYPTSSYDYWRALPILAEHYRVIVHDHLGFGFSDKPRDYSYSLVDQADYAIALWRDLGVTEADVLGHDYGSSVATELLARRNFGSEPIKLRSLTLCNGSMHIELANLRVMQRLLKAPGIGPVVARLASEPLFHRNIRRIFADPSFLDAEELNAMWSQLIAGAGRDVLPVITRYIDERYRLWHRWIGALRETDLPIHIVWARQDPVAVEKMAHVLHDEIANSDLQLLDGVGHFPMIEAAERWSAAVLSALRG